MHKTQGVSESTGYSPAFNFRVQEQDAWEQQAVLAHWTRQVALREDVILHNHSLAATERLEISSRMMDLLPAGAMFLAR